MCYVCFKAISYSYLLWFQCTWYNCTVISFSDIILCRHCVLSSFFPGIYLASPLLSIRTLSMTLQVIEKHLHICIVCVDLSHIRNTHLFWLYLFNIRIMLTSKYYRNRIKKCPRMHTSSCLSSDCNSASIQPAFLLFSDVLFCCGMIGTNCSLRTSILIPILIYTHPSCLSISTLASIDAYVRLVRTFIWKAPNP